MKRGGDRWPAAAVLAGLAVLAAYLLPGLSHPGTRWPLWDARVYWWGGQQAARGGPYLAGLPSRNWPSLIGWTMAWSPEVRLPSPAPPHRTRRQL